MSQEIATSAHLEAIIANLGENLRNLRKTRGLSQTELAEAVGFHLSHVNRIETGKQVPSLEFLLKCVEVFGGSVDQLLNGGNEELAEVRLEDKGMAERLRLIEVLDPEERHALMTVIDSMLTKHRIRQFIDERALPVGALR